MPDPTPTLTDEQRSQLDTALRRCRVEDGSPAPLLSDWDRYHVLSMVAPVVARMVADAEQRGRELGRYESTVGHKPEPRDPNYQAGYLRGRAEVSAAVEALADEWDATVYTLPPGYPMTLNEFCRVWFKAPLRAALTDPAAAVARIKADALREAADDLERGARQGVATSQRRAEASDSNRSSERRRKEGHKHSAALKIASWLRARADEVTP